jgi:Rrf2 family protein
MRLTRASEYALRGLAVLAASPVGAATPLEDIARARDLPASFLAKIFQKLARHGVLMASRGPGRGYALAQPAAAISLKTILESVEGPDLFQHCLLLPGHDHRSRCRLHRHVTPILTALIARLDSISLAEFAAVEETPEPSETPS